MTINALIEEIPAWASKFTIIYKARGRSYDPVIILQGTVSPRNKRQ